MAKATRMDILLGMDNARPTCSWVKSGRKKTLGTMAKATLVGNLVGNWTLERQTYRWDKSGRIKH